MGANETTKLPGVEDRDSRAWPASPPIAEFGLHRALKFFAAAVAGILIVAILTQGLTAGAIDWTKLGVGLGIASMVTSAAWSLRFRSDAHGIERRFLGTRTRWAWEDFGSGRLTIGQHGWAPNSNNVLLILWRQPYLEFGQPPGSSEVWRYAMGLFQHAPCPQPEPGREYALGTIGRCAFDVSGVRHKGVAHPWSCIDAIEVELPDRAATRPSSITIRSERVRGTCHLRMGPLAADAASLMSTLEACVPPAKLKRRIRGEVPDDPESRAELRKKLERQRRDARWGMAVVLAAGLTLAGLFLWPSPGRQFQLWQEGLPLWLNLASLAVLAVVVLIGVGHVLVALYLIRRRSKQAEQRLRELGQSTASSAPGR